ncbi:MAG: ATP-binding protein, partial [Lysinibacillus sp.]
MDDLHSLVDVITSITKHTNILNHFYVGFKINQISKEFDLLRIGENSIINIELKRESTKRKITKQLIQNQYYLKFLNVPIYNFTYVALTKKLYMLVDST